MAEMVKEAEEALKTKQANGQPPVKASPKKSKPAKDM